MGTAGQLLQLLHVILVGAIVMGGQTDIFFLVGWLEIGYEPFVKLIDGGRVEMAVADVRQQLDEMVIFLTVDTF